MPTVPNLSVSQQLLKRARNVIPQGIWGHNRFPSTLDPSHYPHFAQRGIGATFIDVDGNEYIDWICGYGAIILGHNDAEVDRAAIDARSRGGCLSLATETTIELAERLTALIQGASWCAFGKSGSDATWIALTIARAYTSQPGVVCIDGAYQGSHGWCEWCNFGSGRLTQDATAVVTIPWGDTASLETVLGRAEPQISAVIVTPFHHPIPGPAAMPPPGYLDQVTELAHRYGALMILDDVRAGFRLDLNGSHLRLGGEPDLICFSKAIANGHPLAAVTGSRRLKDAADSVFIAGTFWNAPDAMAAALVTLDSLERQNVISHITNVGQLLADGIEQIGKLNSVPLRVTGPPQMPTVTIDGDDDGIKMMALCRYLVSNGIFVHPSHNWFVSNSHTTEHVARTIEFIESGLKQGR